jgi:transcription-repair coupling factor (superfamily II helicase)
MLENSRSVLSAGEALSVAASVPVVQSLRERLEQGETLSFDGVCPGAQSFFAVLLARLFPTRPLVVVTDSLKTQELLHQDIETWMEGEDKPLFYPDWEVLPHQPRLPHVDVVSERLQTLVDLTRWGEAKNAPAPIVVASVTALLQKTFPAGEIARRTRTLQKGDSLDLLDLVEWLEQEGYEPEAQVTQKGDISLRGGILDVWPLTSPWPVRLEFFGDELDSLRYFDPLTQISRADLMASVILPPGGELGLLKASPDLPLASLLDYLPDNALFYFCEPELLRAQGERYAEQSQGGDRFFLAWEKFEEELGRRNFGRVEVSQVETHFVEDLLPDATGFVKPSHAPLLRWQGLEAFRPIGDRRPEPHIAEAQRKEFFQQLHRWLRQDYAVHLFCNNDGERRRFEEIWQEYELKNLGALRIHIGALSRGFIFEPAKLVVVTDAEIFGRYKVQRPRRLKSPHAQMGKSLLDINFSDLTEGDYVVHLQHGIGRYLGLRALPETQGRKAVNEATPSHAVGEECLAIEYAASDTSQPPPVLYVPVSQSHLVSKYVGAGRARPPLNTLGGMRWAKTKALAQDAVRDVASEMLAIQAVRSSQEGFAFPPDAPWQGEFEDSFLYEETPDQARAIVAAKTDMEGKKPMDRLICGDVGYGKTEVAIRAAFKAALAGKQVAVLVPTTVLAQQHFNTFRERMADYPLRIELLSRFRTRRDQARVIRDLAAGAVDIVIGTHRLVQSDITFKDLGLVVIDEEQRFGVLHKEKFKRLRTMVDVLTLTATPIPRTLYLALAGARDMSTIETPPQDRLPVETFVAQFDERLIREAIQRELNRGGQVFYLHNRVFDIEGVAKRLRELVPQARIAVGHGQMHSDELEEVMATFVNGQTDVLLSTTIIESGLDIPNANTIIIDRADRFGLSDLYQLRGRVGRYKHQAYAYLLLPRHAGLLTDARKRISAIQQYSSLGSGFKIAMRDLEIRGAGNLLGAQQSGHIAAVGFELYCQLLKQSVSSLKGEKVQARLEVEVRLDFLEAEADGASSARLPAGYIPEAQQRIEAYRKLAQLTNAASCRALKDEWRDRYGPLPAQAEMLLKIAELKVIAGAREISIIETKEDTLMITRRNDFVMAGGKFPRLIKTSARARLEEIKKFVLTL